MITPVEFTYVGPAAFAGLFANQLREAGLTVRYNTPVETRDAHSAVQSVRVAFEVATDAFVTAEVIRVIRRVVERFRDRFTVEDLPPRHDDESEDRNDGP